MRKLRRILLVDDDEVANYLSNKLLKRMNVTEEVVTLFDGMEALAYVRQHYPDGQVPGSGPDLVLLDLNMPIMDGFEFLENLALLPFQDELAVCIVSSSSHERDVERASSHRIKGFISKPLTEEKIRVLLEGLA